MKRKIERISPHQNGKTLCIVGGVAMLPLYLLAVVPGALAAFANGGLAGEMALHGIILFVTPMLHIAIIYLFFVLFCLTYNRLSRRLGRFEIEFDEMAPERDEQRNYPSGGGCRPSGAKTAMLES